MKTKILPFIFISLFFFVFLIFYKGLKNPNIYAPDLKIEKNIPIFKAQIFQKEKLISSEEIFKQDKFYLLNIWASWCIPCREEHIFLTQLSKQEKINIVGLNYKDKDENAKKFLSELGNPYDIILSDKNGILAIEWGAYGVPESFLVYNNKIVKKIIGPINQKSFLEFINLLK
tara:strand:+ start:1169 stop:1687 length:519 start_codon:yes stop_codon:yes gene_type:complete